MNKHNARKVGDAFVFIHRRGRYTYGGSVSVIGPRGALEWKFDDLKPSPHDQQRYSEDDPDLIDRLAASVLSFATAEESATSDAIMSATSFVMDDKGDYEVQRLNCGPETVNPPASRPRRVSMRDTLVDSWLGKEQPHVSLFDREGNAIIWWEDSEVKDLIRDGVLDPKSLHESAYLYAEELGLVVDPENTNMPAGSERPGRHGRRNPSVNPAYLKIPGAKMKWESLSGSTSDGTHSFLFEAAAKDYIIVSRKPKTGRDDFWLTLELGEILGKFSTLEEAIRFAEGTRTKPPAGLKKNPHQDWEPTLEELADALELYNDNTDAALGGEDVYIFVWAPDSLDKSRRGAEGEWQLMSHIDPHRHQKKYGGRFTEVHIPGHSKKFDPVRAASTALRDLGLGLHTTNPASELDSDNWLTFAGGTGAWNREHNSFSVRTDRGTFYIDPPQRKGGQWILRFAATDRFHPPGSHGGLWHDLGSFRTSASAKKAARDTYERLER